MLPEDISRYHDVTDVRLQPGGKRAIYATARADHDTDSYVKQLWLWVDGGSRQLTSGTMDHSPNWSPDGTAIAFIRGAGGAAPQVAVIPVDGGESRIVTDFALGVRGFAWSPDSAALVVVAATWTREWADLSDDERRRRPRRLTSLGYRANGAGWTHDRRNHLYLVELATDADAPRCLTPGDGNEVAPVWHPGGQWIAFLVDERSRWGVDPGREVREVEVATLRQRTILAAGSWTRLSYDPSGVLHAVGDPDPWQAPARDSVWRVSSDGELENLTSELDRGVSPKKPASSPAGPLWLDDGFLVTVEDRGRVSVLKVKPNGKHEPVVAGNRCVTGVDADPAGWRIAYGVTHPTCPGEVHLLESGQERVISSVNAAFRADTALVSPRRFVVERPAGHDVDAWLYLPEGSEKVPVLLNIHGGPSTQYADKFFDEFQVYVAAGFAVLACNPRGSSGCGAEFADAVRGSGWGRVDVEDVLAVVEHALAMEPRLDAARRGIMGGSYGGYLTATIISRSSQWRSAVIERAPSAWDSLAGTSDIGPFFSPVFHRADMPQDFLRLWDISTLPMAALVDTPVLLIHAENDWTCPIEQAERYFTALVRAGARVEFLRFPDEGHELSKTGKPQHRIERLAAICTWHREHLS